jgi:hypothetical protein
MPMGVPFACRLTVEIGGFDVIADARLRDHAAIADHHDMIEVEALLGRVPPSGVGAVGK